MPTVKSNSSTVSTAAAVSTAPATLLAWDLPTRIAKWLLAALVGLAFVSKYYGDVGLVWHQWNGLAILVVIVFRLFWGVVGGSTARFASFVYGPGRGIGYLVALLRGRPQHYLGHSPIGGWIIVALLALVGAQALTGLFTTDDIIVYGPLTNVVSDATMARASALHGTIFQILLWLIGIHVAANVAYSVFGRDNLILAMLSGRKPVASYIDKHPATPGSIALALVCLIAAIGVVFGGIALAGGNPFP